MENGKGRLGFNDIPVYIFIDRDEEEEATGRGRLGQQQPVEGAEEAEGREESGGGKYPILQYKIDLHYLLYLLCFIVGGGRQLDEDRVVPVGSGGGGGGAGHIIRGTNVVRF